jgi:5-methylcytosine-specific restriction enzyme subunit McrC
MSPLVSVRMQEWESRSPGATRGDPLAGLLLDGERERTVAAQLSRMKLLGIRELACGLELQSTSYVGRVRLGRLEVTITPKIPGPALLRLFRYAYGLRDLQLIDDAHFADDGSLFLDLLLTQLHAEARELVSRGLHRRYRAVAEDLASPRGRIDMRRLATRSVASSGTLPCHYHVRLEDCLVNQVLLGGLRLGAALAADRALAGSLHRLAETLAPMVSIVPLTESRLAQARRGLDRLTAAYAPGLALIKLLVDGVSPALEDPDAEPVVLPGFLFDMNRFFQHLVGRFLRENFEGGKVREEHQLETMMRYAAGENPRGRRPPRQRPDFAVTTCEGKLLLLDAKYRDLWQTDLPREMLYQLALYALSQPSPGRATIIYPTMAREARTARIEIREPTGGWARGCVVLQPIHLEEVDALVMAGSERTAAAARKAMARQLTLGVEA